VARSSRLLREQHRRLRKCEVKSVLSISKFNSRSQPDSHIVYYYNSVTVTFRCDISYDIENCDIGAVVSRSLDAPSGAQRSPWLMQDAAVAVDPCRMGARYMAQTGTTAHPSASASSIVASAWVRPSSPFVCALAYHAESATGGGRTARTTAVAACVIR
jgi:hypothetical protein